ncbi:hypothetical protein NLX83_26630 [Allokutzneria sp. A3M-2-11 16]|uniref:hypothetical protein n=1 Tax=Allokutzneria sp. A3M-2-11 16 TaxID=2962043 RepID=UPI0020B80F75|nr:hypothetical protein [Allokutzneria sp. A3M-2-11 16]MCP3802856.1 hypothetical protein [Allokutzneria sp. A3M-2-11 16]
MRHLRRPHQPGDQWTPVNEADQNFGAIMLVELVVRPVAYTTFDPGADPRRGTMAELLALTSVLRVDHLVMRVRAVVETEGQRAPHGGADRIATAVLESCEAFTHRWRTELLDPPVFNRELTVLEEFLDAIALDLATGLNHGRV